MSTAPNNPLAVLRAVNQTSAFNTWCGMQVDRAEAGRVEVSVPWRSEFGQYAGFMRAGLIGALIDTACGFAAATLVGQVLASHYSVKCLRPAVCESFVVRAKVATAGLKRNFS